MKKSLAFVLTVLMMLFLVACGSSESKDTDNSSIPSPEDLGLQTTNTNYTRDFDSTTNQTITFGDIMFQIPKGWSTGDSTDVAIQINGLSESQAGPMWLELLDSGMSEDDLASAACQQAISDAYVGMMEQSFDNVKVTNSNYNSQSQLYFMNIEASAYNIPAECGVCAFVEQGNLYVYLVPFMEGDEYDYSLDVQEIVKSVSAVDQADDAFDFSTVPTATYDSIVSGNHTGEIVCIEAIISAYEYDDSLEMYEFDLWYWSDKENRYIQDEGCFIFADDYSAEAIEPLKTFDDGDKIRMVLEVYADDSFGPSGYVWSELIEKGELSDVGIPSSPEDNQSTTDHGADISTADTSDIAVRFETDYIDGDRLHITVFTKNNSDETFTGNVYVTFYSADGKDRLGSDTIIVDELLPGRESWADIIVDVYRGTPKMTVDFSEVSFTPIKEITAEIDTDATEKTKSSYYWNFDGVSWYNDITDIVVYTDGTCVVTVKKETKENGQFYAATIWSCGNDYGVEEVQVVDPDGKILAVY